MEEWMNWKYEKWCPCNPGILEYLISQLGRRCDGVLTNSEWNLLKTLVVRTLWQIQDCGYWERFREASDIYVTLSWPKQKDWPIINVPLAPFKGNRFNIVFHNSAWLSSLLSELKEFFEEHKQDNLLFKAVHADLCIHQYLTAAHALLKLDRQVGDRSIVACYQRVWSRFWHEWALCSHAGVLY